MAEPLTVSERQGKMIELQRCCGITSPPGFRVFQTMLNLTTINKSEIPVLEVLLWVYQNKSSHYISRHVRNCGPRIEAQTYDWLDKLFGPGDAPTYAEDVSRIEALERRVGELERGKA